MKKLSSIVLQTYDATVNFTIKGIMLAITDLLTNNGCEEYSTTDNGEITATIGDMKYLITITPKG